MERVIKHRRRKPWIDHFFYPSGVLEEKMRIDLKKKFHESATRRRERNIKRGKQKKKKMRNRKK